MARIPKHLISRFLENDLSPDEIRKLKSWMKEPENKRLLKKEIHLYHLVNEHFKTFNPEEAYAKNKDKLKRGKIIAFKPQSVWRYAVAASVVLIIGLTFFFNRNHSENNKNAISNTDSTISIGTDKAVLTLENGNVVLLGDEQKYSNGNLISDGTSVIYKTQQPESNTVSYNTLTVPRGGQYSIKLSDGTEVWLNSESQLKYPVSFKSNQTRTVELLYGEAFFDVSPSTKHKGAKFMVHHARQDIEVVGTKFNLKAYSDETFIYTTLVEGLVNVNTDTEKVVLNPGKQSVFDKGTSSIRIQDADILSETSWTKGDFFFQRKSLQEIVKVLSRWYDIDIVIEDESLKTIEFTGELSKHQNIEDILNLIKETNLISSFTVDNHKIVIR